MNITRTQLIDALVSWRLSMPGGAGEEYWRTHYEAENTQALEFFVNFYQIHIPGWNRLTNAAAETAQEDPVEGEERSLTHEFAVELLPGVTHGPMTYLEAVEGWKNLKREVYPVARVVERVVSEWREVKHIDRRGLKLVDQVALKRDQIRRGPDLLVEPIVDELADFEMPKPGWDQPEGEPQKKLAEKLATWCICGNERAKDCPAHPPMHPRAPDVDEAYDVTEATLIQRLKDTVSGADRFGPREDPGCIVCGRDNRNGTHTALERTGHLTHSFQPAVEKTHEGFGHNEAGEPVWRGPEVIVADPVEEQLIQNVKDAASGADRYRPAPEPYEPDETYTPCPGMPEHYREAHRPGGAWWGVTFDHAHNDDGQEYAAYVLEKMRKHQDLPELWTCELHPQWRGATREGVAAHIAFKHQGAEITTEPDRVIREKKS